MIGWLVAAACSFTFFFSLASEFVREGEYAQVDGRAAASIRQLASPVATRLFHLITDAHGTLPISIAVGVIAVFLLYRRAWRTVAWLLAVVPGGMVLNVAVKHVLQRPRPELSSILTADSYSFPSGHTAGAALLYGFLLAWIFASTPSRTLRCIATFMATAAIAAVAMSRVYLQVHYASDVTAALLESAGWLSLCLAARAFISQRRGVDILRVG